ncbi:MAG: cupredoxin domain-containing protein [Rhizomicrobium sp.]
MRFIRHAFAYPVAMLLFIASASAADSNTIIIKKFMFNPMDVTVAAGTDVTWENQDGEPHTVVSLTNDFRSQALDEKDKFSHAFDKPGTYKYICSIHPKMVGTITVVAK